MSHEKVSVSRITEIVILCGALLVVTIALLSYWNIRAIEIVREQQRISLAKGDFF